MPEPSVDAGNPEPKRRRTRRAGQAVVINLHGQRANPGATGRGGGRRYSPEFRAAAVARTAAPDATVAAVAAELGVSASTLRRWIRDERAGPASAPARPSVESEETDDVAEHGRTAKVIPTGEPTDERPLHQRIDEEWPDWRDFDWPVVLHPVGLAETPADAPADASIEPSGDSTADASLDPSSAPPVDLPREPSQRARVHAPRSTTVPQQPLHAEPGHHRHADEIFALTARLRPRDRLLVVLAGFAATLALSLVLPELPALRPVLVGLHVVSLVVSFGAVLLIDWHGLLWLAGRRRLAESTRLAAAASPLIWAGLAGLFVTGAFLKPNITAPLTALKLALVLAVVVNGAVMSPVRRRLAALSEHASPVDVPERDWRRMMVATVISQIGWWGALVIGFINAAT